jgi:hypothetical protein
MFRYSVVRYLRARWLITEWSMLLSLKDIEVVIDEEATVLLQAPLLPLTWARDGLCFSRRATGSGDVGW